MDARDARRVTVALALVSLAALLLWFKPWAGHGTARKPGPSPSQDQTDTDLSPARTPLYPVADEPPPPAATPCTPHADLRCHDGNVFWFDSCGAPTDLVEDCDDRGCDGALCAEPDPVIDDCGRVTPYGECHGSIAQACVNGRLMTVDCASQRERCVMTGEGAACLPLDDKLACNGNEPPLCEGDRLRLCIDGRFRSIDCAARKAHCSNGGVAAHCESSVPQPEPLVLLHTEVCDGRDNDYDLAVDEGVCEEVPLVAFVPQGAQLLSLEVRMQREMAILNQTFAPTKFRWAGTRAAPAAYRSFDVADMDRAADQLARVESKAYVRRNTSPFAPIDESAGLDFYVPVLFTEALDTKPPKAGISTLPNARCGGVRISDAPSPASGLIILTEARQPETLAHEMGHYLGLCHTHEQLQQFSVQSLSSDIASCGRSGDGICDTPVDPGSPACFRSTQACELECHAGEHPDPFNIMSYYFGCRRVLSEDQLSEAARNLQLRRAWFRCLDPRDCPCTPNDKAACPSEMSCHPSGAANTLGYMCELDGAGAPGTFCKAASQCSARGICLSGTGVAGTGVCVRPCDAEPGCTCMDVGLSVRVCAEDLR